MTNRSIEIRPVTPYLGAEVFGIDLSSPLDATETRTVHQALLAHQVIFFRDQEIDLPSQVAFGKLFGALHAHPNREGPQGFREVLPIHTDARSKRVAGEDWHSDVSCDALPPMGSILHLHTVPEVGGDTLFASQYAAYDALSDRMKAYLDGLTALHSGDHVYRSQNVRDGVAETGKVYPSAVHPVVRTHPETGRRALFVNPFFTLRINELPEPESRAVLAFLYAQATRPEFQLRFRWRRNSVAFWDNRCVQHMALWDYFPHTRSGFRVDDPRRSAVLTIHHLGHSQSERIVWLCEELDVPYALVRHERDPVTILSPPALRALHPLGAAPVIEDDGLVLAESAAVVEYIIARHGGGRLRLGPDHPDFAAYLYWFHFANGNLQPVIGRLMMLGRVGLAPDHPVQMAVQGRLDRVMALVEARLGEAPFLAGGEFTAADVMSVFSLTTMRLFQPIDLRPHPNVLAYLARIGARPAYRRATAKGDPDLVPMLS